MLLQDLTKQQSFRENVVIIRLHLRSNPLLPSSSDTRPDVSAHEASAFQKDDMMKDVQVVGFLQVLV